VNFGWWHWQRVGLAKFGYELWVCEGVFSSAVLWIIKIAGVMVESCGREISGVVIAIVEAAVDGNKAVIMYFLY
jgi:hypothetical protein